MRHLNGIAYQTAQLHPRERQPTVAALGFEHIADELRTELAAAVRDRAPWQRSRVAFVVRADGVDVVQRYALREHYRRHGLRDLARTVASAPLGRVLVVLEGDEVAVLAVDPAAWIPDVTTGAAVARDGGCREAHVPAAALTGFDSSSPDQGGKR